MATLSRLLTDQLSPSDLLAMGTAATAHETEHMLTTLSDKAARSRLLTTPTPPLLGAASEHITGGSGLSSNMCQASQGAGEGSNAPGANAVLRFHPCAGNGAAANPFASPSVENALSTPARVQALTDGLHSSGSIPPKSLPPALDTTQLSLRLLQQQRACAALPATLAQALALSAPLEQQPLAALQLPEQLLWQAPVSQASTSLSPLLSWALWNQMQLSTSQAPVQVQASTPQTQVQAHSLHNNVGLEPLLVALGEQLARTRSQGL